MYPREPATTQGKVEASVGGETASQIVSSRAEDELWAEESSCLYSRH